MWQKTVRYLDYNATSGLSERVREKLKELLSSPEILANPSSRHRPGQRARKLLYDSAARVAKSLSGNHADSVSQDDFIFTASGTEANQSVLHSLSQMTELILIGAGEHSSSADWAASVFTAKSLVKTGFISLLQNGQYNLTDLATQLKNARALGIQTVGLSLTLANNETGVLLDLPALKKVMAESKLQIILHLDGAQVWGKVPLDLPATFANFVTFSAHKIGAPAGTGLIWIKKGTSFTPLISGSQAHGLRGGTENLIGIAGTGFAAEELDPKLFSDHTHPLQIRLEKGLKEIGYPVRIWGEDSPRVPNTTRFSILNFSNYQNWVELLDLKGYAVSHGSACKAQVIEPSHVLLKMGASREDALNSLRISFGPGNTNEDVDGFLEALKQTLSHKSEEGSRG